MNESVASTPTRVAHVMRLYNGNSVYDLPERSLATLSRMTLLQAWEGIKTSWPALVLALLQLEMQNVESRALCCWFGMTFSFAWFSAYFVRLLGSRHFEPKAFVRVFGWLSILMNALVVGATFWWIGLPLREYGWGSGFFLGMVLISCVMYSHDHLTDIQQLKELA